MTTIFIENLKQLIAGQLRLRWSELNTQKTAYNVGPVKLGNFVHNPSLSDGQRNIIGTLEGQILTFKGTGNDEEDKNIIKGYLTVAKKAVEDLRRDHNADGDSATLSCLEKISNATENFYMQLEDISFPLLNLPNKSTPEYLVYFHACAYLGLAKFQPDSHSSIDIRKQKEKALFKRLESLKKAIQPSYTLDEQRAVTLQMLNDLKRDNEDIVKPKKPFSIPFFSAGVAILSMPVKAQTSSEGTLEEEISSAIRKINEMTEETSHCPRAKANIMRPMVKTPSAEERQKEWDESSVILEEDENFVPRYS